MSTHPNVILLCALKPDDLARKTLRLIREDMGVEEGADFQIGTDKYHVKMMEDDYDEGYQIGSDEGDIVIFDFVTYGYGEQVSWEKLSVQKEELEAWAKQVCEKFSCSYKIAVTANYW